jgi:cytochrome c553
MSSVFPRHGARILRAYARAAIAASLAFGSVVTGAAAAGQNQPNQELLATCAACHGETGNSVDPATPKLAGQKRSYLAAQLEAFRSGRRKSDTMSAIAATLSRDQIASLARYFASEPRQADHVDDTRRAAFGERIYWYGGRGVPACAACHEPQRGGGMGMMGGMGHRGMGYGGMGYGGMGGMMRFAADAPRLSGQHAAYVVGQLDAFARGKRPATVMGGIAASLSSDERKAVAAYISGLR